MLHCERNNADKVESMSEEQKIRVVIADDQELVRAGFAMVIGSQPDMARRAMARKRWLWRRRCIPTWC